jgi:hypothetical protein
VEVTPDVATQLREEQSRVAASLRDQIASLTSKMETLLNQTSEATVPVQSTIRRTTAPTSTSRTSTQSTPAPNVSLRTDQHKADRDLVYEDSLDVLETSEPAWKELRDYRRYRLSRKSHELSGIRHDVLAGHFKTTACCCQGGPFNGNGEGDEIKTGSVFIFLRNWQKRQQLPTSPKGMSTTWLRSWLEEM